MGSSTLITDYMGEGTHAARPNPATLAAMLPAAATAIYSETDTGNVFALIAGVWVQINGGGGGGGPTTIGYCNPTGFTNFGGGNFLQARVLCIEDISISNICYASMTASAGANIIPCCYADNAGSNTGALIAQGPAVADTVVGINNLPLSALLSMTAGDWYWIGFMVTGSGIQVSQGYLQNTGYAGTAGATTPPSTGPNTGVGDGYLCWGSI